ncbi:MAG: GH116 family glycosyl hydrolase [Bacteroidales bacterium]
MKKVIPSRGIMLLFCLLPVVSCVNNKELKSPAGHDFNGSYSGKNLDRIAFPVGGIGAGMFCVEGTGAVSHMSVRNHPAVFNEPCMFAAVAVKGLENGAKIIEGNVPDWKKFGSPESGNGSPGTTYGLPRFENASFLARFPFAEINLQDDDIPLDVKLTAWSPFIPADQDNSSLPAGAFEYTFRNTGDKPIDVVFSYNSVNFMATSGGNPGIKGIQGGFILSESGSKDKPEDKGEFAVFTNEPGAVTDLCWFRGGWWDPMTMTWNTISKGETRETKEVSGNAPGASLYVPFNLKQNESKTIRVMMAWYVPDSKLRYGKDAEEKRQTSPNADCSCKDQYYKPWYSARFAGIDDVITYWKSNYSDLRANSGLFRDAFYGMTLPPEVIEAIAANLTILKSPTVLRQTDGKLWNWEGCGDNWGCCAGSCTHVWNYAQAVPHLFPKLERTMRSAEFFASQDAEGHQTFRSALPIRPIATTFYAASDGQLGGIMKMYRDWHISGNNDWLKLMYPQMVRSMDYCISTWDPRHTGTLEEPHHNTYDIEFWGPDGMCTSFYLGALKAMTEIGSALGENVDLYKSLYESGKTAMENQLFNGEYFFQKITWKGLNAADPSLSDDPSIPPETKSLLATEGPKYQYGTGCLSDGVLGAWMAEVCGLGEIIDHDKTKSHLLSVFKYNFRKDLGDHQNPQRPSYALGREGGLLLCSWPNGGALSLPFVYSNEVWTGIEYQVASHLMMMGEVEKGLEIVRTCRQRYDGTVRNPFDEYECGHWYARAMSSYAMIQGLTGIQYDALTGTLYLNKDRGDFRGFISTETGFGNAGIKDGKPFIEVVHGEINVRKTELTEIR